jgi:hypothetical protein
MILSVFFSVRESKIRLRPGRVMFPRKGTYGLRITFYAFTFYGLMGLNLAR